MTDTDGAILLIAVLGAGLVGFFVYYAFWRPEARQRRLMRSIALSRAAQAEDGKLTRIVGVVEATDDSSGALQAPLSQRACAYYASSAWFMAGRAAQELAKEETRRDFKVRDASGVVLVVSTDASFDVAKNFLERSGPLHAPNQVQVAYLQKHRISPTNKAGINNSFMYVERALVFGEKVAVLGVAKREGDHVSIVAPPGGKLAISNAPALVRDDVS